MCYIFGNLGVQGYPIRNSHRNLIRFDPKSIKIQNVMDKWWRKELIWTISGQLPDERVPQAFFVQKLWPFENALIVERKTRIVNIAPVQCLIWGKFQWWAKKAFVGAVLWGKINHASYCICNFGLSWLIQLCLWWIFTALRDNFIAFWWQTLRTAWSHPVFARLPGGILAWYSSLHIWALISKITYLKEKFCHKSILAQVGG